MPSHPRLTRWDAVWAGGCVAVFLLLAVAARTPFFYVVLLSGVGAAIVLGVSEWRSRGHAWLPTLSWAVPLAGFWIGGLWLVRRPIVLVVLMYAIGFALLAAMLLSTRAAMWWYRAVLRRPFKT